MQGLGELPGVHGGGPQVARLARLDDVMQRLERLLDRRRRVPTMDLIEIDVVRTEPPQTRIDCVEYRLARQAAPVGALAHREENLGRDHHLVAARIVFERLTDDFLGGAVRVGVRGIEEVDAHLDRLANQRAALLLRQGPQMIAALGGTEGHATEAQR